MQNTLWYMYNRENTFKLPGLTVSENTARLCSSFNKVNLYSLGAGEPSEAACTSGSERRKITLK